MGAACCVASREKTITNASNSDVLHRNIRHSPSWSFRWDHRGRVAGEETSMSWFSDAVSRNAGSEETKLDSAYASEEGSPLDNFRRRASSQKSEVASGHVRTPASGKYRHHFMNSNFFYWVLSTIFSIFFHLISLAFFWLV